VEGWSYFQSIWNWIDTVPPIIMITLLIAETSDAINLFKGDADLQNEKRLKGVKGDVTIFAISISIATLLLWMRLLYFLRIFDTTGFLIRAIIQVMSEMKYFMMILMIAYFAFGDSYKVISLANPNVSEGGSASD